MGTSKFVSILKEAATLYSMYLIRKERLMDCHVNVPCLDVGTRLKVICPCALYEYMNQYHHLHVSHTDA
jgi:hypothetical protein